MVFRSREYLEQHVDDFHVFCIDEEIAGCVEFQTSRDNPAALIGSLMVSASHHNQGIGRGLVEAIIQEARKRECRNFFALTMSQPSIFVQCGFEEVEPEELPEWKLKDLDSPESRVFRFKINRS